MEIWDVSTKKDFFDSIVHSKIFNADKPEIKQKQQKPSNFYVFSPKFLNFWQQQSEEGQDLLQKDCEKCRKTVFHVDKVKIGGKLFHKACVACQECQNSLL